MVAKGLIVAAALMVLVRRSLSLSCEHCPWDIDKKLELCGPTPTCSYGLTKGVCGCCDVCAKGPGERCGGIWGFSGDCAKGLECQVENCTKYCYDMVGTCEPRQDCVLNGKVYQHKETNDDSCFVIRCNNGNWEFKQQKIVECGMCSVDRDQRISTFDKTSFLPEGYGNIYEFSRVDNFVITQKGLGRSSLFGLRADFEHCDPPHAANLSCIKSLNYYEPSISFDLVLPVQINITDPKSQIKVKLNGTDYQHTGKQSFEFPSTLGTVLIFKTDIINFDCMHVVGSQGLSVSLCVHGRNYGRNFPDLFVNPMPTLKGQLYGLCNTYTGTVQNDFTISSGARTQVIDFFEDSWEITMLAK